MPKWTDKVGRDDFDAICQKALPAIGRMLEDTAVVLCPVDTGRLRGSITYATKFKKDRPRGEAKQNDAVTQPTSKYKCYVGTNVEYAPYVEYGTGPHVVGGPVDLTIRGKHIGWRYIGQHPGTQAQSFLRKALDYGADKARDIFKRAIQRHLRGQ